MIDGPKLHPLVAFMGKRYEYIACMEQGPATNGSPKHTQLLKDSVEAIITEVVSSKSIDLDSGKKLHDLILKSPLDEMQKNVLMSRVDERVDLHSSNKSPKQINMLIHNVMTEGDWDVISDKTSHPTRSLCRWQKCSLEYV